MLPRNRHPLCSPGILEIHSAILLRRTYRAVREVLGPLACCDRFRTGRLRLDHVGTRDADNAAIYRFPSETALAMGGSFGNVIGDTLGRILPCNPAFHRGGWTPDFFPASRCSQRSLSLGSSTSGGGGWTCLPPCW